MSESWDNFMEAPDELGQAPGELALPKQAVLPPPGVKTSAQPEAPPPAKPAAGFHGYTLPESVMENAGWRGDKNDLKFGLREPDSEGTWQFMERMTGRPEDVLPYLACGGRHRGGAEILAWWHTRTPKVQNCILQQFIMLVVPTEVDVLEVRSSKRRSGDRSSYTLPVSVMDSRMWTGGLEDLSFQIRDATAAEVRQLGSREGSVADCLDFVERDAPKLWWARLSPKAQALVNRMFVDTLQPTGDEGNAIRASRTWVEG